MRFRPRYLWDALNNDVEQFNALISVSLYDDALAFFREKLDAPTLFGLEPSLHRATLLLSFFPDGEAAPPRLSDPHAQAFVLHALALTLNLTGGYPARAVPLYKRHDLLAERLGDAVALSQSLGQHAKALRQAGLFRAAEAVAWRGLQLIRARGDHLREAVNLYWLGMGLAQRGADEESEIALQRSLRIMRAKFATQAEGVVRAFLAQRALWLLQPAEAREHAARAWAIGAGLLADDSHADQHGAAKVAFAAARMHGEALVSLGDYAHGRKRLLYALEQARAIEFTEEELPALRALALLAYRANDLATAREYLARTWELAERGPFALYHADSYNILAAVECAAGNSEAALNAARRAYVLSWCDGPPFAYRRGLEDAAAHLDALGQSAPKLASYCPEKYAPMPEIAINPPDNFGQ